MFFTQDDYKKIQQWLIKNSVKDTEFNEANIPFNGEETIAIVQGNQNKKVFLKDLTAQVFNLGISDFVNITDKYNAPNISLEEAIKLIPSRARKEGQVITFSDIENHWYIYQFKGTLNQWNILDQWSDLFKDNYVNSILPDEEDLTKSSPDENGNSYLSFKDKRYNKLDFSGLGKVHLRKNIINGVNTLLQKDINKDNTIYTIQYDYDLNGSTIEIPEGCVLDFEGGSVSNGVLVGNFTTIKENPVQIFGSNLILEGTWNVEQAYPEWFGAKGDGVTDDAEAIQKTVNYFNNTILLDKQYAVYTLNESKSCIIVPSNRKISGKKYAHSGSDNYCTIDYKGTEKPNAVIEISGGVTLQNFSVSGYDKPSENLKDIANFSSCIKTTGTAFASRLILDNIMVRWGDIGFNLTSYLSSINNCYSNYNYIGFYLHGRIDSSEIPQVEGTSFTLANCYAMGCKLNGFRCVGITYSTFTNLAADSCGSRAFDVIKSYSEVNPSYYFSYCQSIGFNNCGVEVALKYLKLHSCTGFTMNGCRFYMGWESPDMYTEDYFPGHIIELGYSTNVRVENFIMNVGGPLSGKMKELLQSSDTWPLIYIEQGNDNLVRYFFTGIPVEYYNYNKNIKYGGSITKNSVYIENTNTVASYPSVIEVSGSDNLQKILMSDKVVNNPNNCISLHFVQVAPELGYSHNTIDLKGKTIIVTSDNAFTGYGSTPVKIKNGTLIFKNTSIADAKSDYAEKDSLFKCESANLIFEECIIFNLGYTYNSGYICNVDLDSFVKAYNCIFKVTDFKLAKRYFYKDIRKEFPKYKYTESTFIDTVFTYEGVEYKSLGDGQPRLTTSVQYVESLPSRLDDNIYNWNYAMSGVTLFYNGKLVTYNGTNWVDYEGTPITE